jgi:hypothetical protein
MSRYTTLRSQHVRPRPFFDFLMTGSVAQERSVAHCVSIVLRLRIKSLGWSTHHIHHPLRHAVRGKAPNDALESFKMPSKSAALSAGQNWAVVVPEALYSTWKTALFAAM